MQDPKTVREQSAESTRFGKGARTGNMYKEMYGKESLLNALDDWGEFF